MLITTNPLQKAVLDALLTAVTGPLIAAEVHLFTAGPDPLNSGGSDPGLFTEPVSTGLGMKVPTWTLPHIGPDGEWEVDSMLLNWIATAAIPVGGESVLGYFFTDTGATTVLFADYFFEPQNIAVVSQGFSISIPVLMDNLVKPGSGQAIE
jgi:hypothetical protein